jgi:hypothetical protein
MRDPFVWWLTKDRPLGETRKRLRRALLAAAVAAPVIAGAWTWVFIHYHLTVGIGIDLFLLYCSWLAWTSFRKLSRPS